MRLVFPTRIAVVCAPWLSWLRGLRGRADTLEVAANVDVTTSNCTQYFKTNQERESGIKAKCNIIFKKKIRVSLDSIKFIPDLGSEFPPEEKRVMVMSKVPFSFSHPHLQPQICSQIANINLTSYAKRL